MELTFFPALRAYTQIALPPQPGLAQDLVFKVVFPSREEYDKASRDGVHIEIWTDLPISGRARGKWSGIAFETRILSFVANADADREPMLELFSQDEESGTAAASDDHSLYATLPLVLYDLAPVQFSYTYRLVYPSGKIEWFGKHGQDGVVRVERRYPGVNLGIGWRLWDDGRCVLQSGAEEIDAGVLSGEVKWSSCAVGRDSSPVFSFTAESAPSSTIVLFPQQPAHAHTIVLPQPLILSASPGTSVRVSPSGHVHYMRGADIGHLSLGTFDGSSVDAFTALVLGANGPHIAVDIAVDHKGESPCIVIASRPPDAMFPIVLSAISLRFNVLSTAVRIHTQALVALSPDVLNEQHVLYCPSSRKGIFVASAQLQEDIHITLHVGHAGGQAILSPAYALAAPNGPGKGTWELALLVPHVNPSISLSKETELKMEDPSLRVLPTPPPSPPPVRMKPPVALSAPPTVWREPTLPSIASVLAIPGALPPSTSTTSIASTDPASGSPVRSSARDALALVRTSSGITRPIWLQALFAIFSMLWRAFLKRLAIMWIGADGTSLRAKGEETVNGNDKRDGKPWEPEGPDDQEIDDSGPSSADIEEFNTSDDVEDTKTDVPPSLNIPTPRIGTSQLFSLRQEPTGGSPSFSADVRDMKDGTITMLVRAPVHASPTTLKLTLDGKRISELHLSGLQEEHTYLFEAGVEALEGKLEVSFAE